MTHCVAIELGDVVRQLVERNQIRRGLPLDVFWSQPPARLQTFGNPTLVFGDREHLEFLVGEFERWCAYVMQRRDGAPDTAQLDRHVAGLCSVGFLTRLVQLRPGWSFLAGGELSRAPLAVDGDRDPLERPARDKLRCARALQFREHRYVRQLATCGRVGDETRHTIRA